MLKDKVKESMLIGGVAFSVGLYLAGLVGCVYIGYLIVMALKKYIGA